MLLLSTTAWAGPWIKAPGEHYVKLGGSGFVATEYVDPSVEAASDLEYAGWLASVYAEVGVLEGLQVTAQLPWSLGTNTESVGGRSYSSRGLGDALLGVGADVPGVALPLSVSLLSRLPLYDETGRPELHPSLGDAQVDVDALVAVGQGGPLGAHAVWGLAEAGYRARTAWSPSATWTGSAPSDGLTYRAQAGWLPRVGERGLGWVSLDASGLVNLQHDPSTKQWHQWNLGVAAALARGFHLEVGAQQIYAAQASSKGFGGSVGLSKVR